MFQGLAGDLRGGVHTECVGSHYHLRTVDVEVDLRMFSSDPLCLPDSHVTDQLADVLHVVNVLSEQVALHLQSVRVRGEPGS